jgi:hypothetical protein
MDEKKEEAKADHHERKRKDSEPNAQVVKPASKVTAKPRVLIYVGPSIPHLGLFPNAIYQGELPEQVRAYLDKEPHLNRYFVPVADYHLTRAK